MPNIQISLKNDIRFFMHSNVSKIGHPPNFPIT